MNEPHSRAAFRSMDEGTAEDWADHRQPILRLGGGPARPRAAHLKLLDGDYGGFPIDRLQHRCRPRPAPTAAARARNMS